MTTWRDKYPPHPAAEVFPMLEGTAMVELCDDIHEHGVRTPVVLWRDPQTGETLTLDGRNRFEAAERCGKSLLEVPVRVLGEHDDGMDPLSYVISANVHRRHLTQEQKREAVAKLVKLDPSRSDRQTAKDVGVSPTTVGTVRRELEEKGDVSRLDTRTDTQGREQPATKWARLPRLPEEREAEAVKRETKRMAHIRKLARAIGHNPIGHWNLALTQVQDTTALVESLPAFPEFAADNTRRQAEKAIVQLRYAAQEIGDRLASKQPDGTSSTQVRMASPKEEADDEALRQIIEEA